MTRSSVGVCIAALVLSACGGGPKSVHTAPDESRPHISWEIRAGGDYGSEDFVCGSAAPNAPCSLPASKPSLWTFVAIYIDLHPAARPTNYIGRWRAPFLQGWTDTEFREVNDSVKPGEKPHQVTVSGIVTRQPGTYSLSVTLQAAAEGSPTNAPISLSIPVTVFAIAQ
jgi:hypothetical protein